MTPVDLVIFDCDGVLVDSEILSRRAMASVLNDAGVPATVEMIERFTGMKQADIIAGVAAVTGVPVPETVAPRFWPAIRAIYEGELAALEGIGRVLARLPTPRCVASSSLPERIRESLRITGLDAHFDDAALFSSHQVANGKPAPDLFLFAADRMGADPARCVVVEDSVAGIMAAKAAGMRVIGFVGASHAGGGAYRDAIAAAGPDRIAEGHAETLDHLLALAGVPAQA